LIHFTAADAFFFWLSPSLSAFPPLLGECNLRLCGGEEVRENGEIRAFERTQYFTSGYRYPDVY
jgi:hypothetical protein